MHVLFIPKWYPGRQDPQLGDFIRKQAIAVAARVKTSVLLVAMLPDTTGVPSQEEEVKDGLFELRCWYKGSTLAWAPARKAINLLRYWRAAMRGWRRIARERGKPDVVHAYIMVRPALVAAWLRLWNDVPFVIGEQSSEYLTGAYASSTAFRKAIHIFLFRRAARVTAVSDHLARALADHGLCRNAVVVPNVIPGTERPLPARGPANEFLVVADLVDRVKNVSGVLRALKSARDMGHDLRLSIIGDGEDGATLRAMAKDLGLNGSVTFLGRVSQPEVLDAMARTGTVIINSNVETFSVVTGEALAMGRPVIATRCGGPQAFVNDANGALIERGDDAALTTAMLRMADATHAYDPATVRATIHNDYSSEAVGRAMLEVYEAVIAQRHG